MIMFKYLPVFILTAVVLIQSCKKSDESPRTAPTGLTTIAATQIEPLTAKVGGQVATTGGSTISSFGICYSKTRLSPTIDDQVTYATGNPLEPFYLTLTGLSQNTRYYFASFATNEIGTTYGSVMQFTTSLLPMPTLITDLPGSSSIFDTTASVSANITDDAGLLITERGFCWKISVGSEEPTLAHSKKAMGGGNGAFSGNIGGLQPVFTYKMRAYATTVNGTAYGNTVEFVTKPGVPRVITHAATNIKQDSAQVPITIASANGAQTKRFGIIISLTANPTDTTDGPFVAKGNAGGGAGSASGTFGGLTPNTTYHARGFCTNAAGIGFGNDIIFTTLP